MDIAPLLNGLINAGAVGVCAAAMFWLVVWLLKNFRQEMELERASHRAEMERESRLREKYYLLLLGRLGMTLTERDTIRRDTEEGA